MKRPQAELVRALWWALWLGVTALAGCGGGGGGGPVAAPAPTLTVPAAANAQALVVDSGPAEMTTAVVNVPYTSVKICVPNTNTCQVIDHVMVDTGSTGLRLLDASVSLPLPALNVAGGALYNCVQFLDQTYMWGAVRSVDLHMGGDTLEGEAAASLPIQVVGAAGDPAAPATCAATGFVAKNTLNALGARGILGVGSALQDCGAACASNAGNGYYYARNTSGLVVGSTVSLGQQLQQPVSRFASDNNGVLIQLPVVAATGASGANGSLVFGIGTQANNQPAASVTVLTFNSQGNFSTHFNGRTLTRGFVDSGSNAYFFGGNFSPIYPICSGGGGWYCPPSTQTLQATNTGANGQTSVVQFSVVNANNAFGRAGVTAMGGLAAPIGDNASFDFGLPFFYGRQVYTAIQGASTSLGTGPFVAY